jgi:hypothetical protein
VPVSYGPTTPDLATAWTPSVYWPVVRDSSYEAMAEQAQGDGGYILHHNRDLRRAFDAAVTAYREWGLLSLRGRRGGG